MSRYVEIAFDCLPLRSVMRMDIPIDASPKYRAHCERVKNAIERHGTHNSYYLYNAECRFHLTNGEEGMLQFSFYGTLVTDDSDQKTKACFLNVQLLKETCDWLTEPIVSWFTETVPRAVGVEFNRYIEAGDLQQTMERIAKLQAEMESQGGYMGMFL